MQDLSHRKFDNMEGQGPIKGFLSGAASQFTFADFRGPLREFPESFSEASVSPFSCASQFIS